MSITNRQTLLTAVDAGEHLSFLFFWGHRPPKNGGVNHSCFSQWYPSPFTLENITYPTAEHYMMAGKARLFKDTATLKEILNTPDPATVKKLGRKVTPFDNKLWQDASFDIVCAGTRAKFSQNTDMKQFLLQTADKIIVEASPYDKIWGIGLKATDPRAQNPHQWPGLNLLGFALMQIRKELS